MSPTAASRQRSLAGLDLGQLEEAARAKRDPAAYDYFAGGSGHERTLAANGPAWSEITLRRGCCATSPRCRRRPPCWAPWSLRALAFGARAVLIGRPLVWALAVGGSDGVRELLATLNAEVEEALALAGARSPAEADADLIAGR